ncbi:MAG: hypothetical protein GY746_12390, partial [Gammaproteobacteria bacterium]|nr:hypothetical protein [Gammaproteobacteria bacterium]
YSWTPAIGLSCADCDAPTASPTNTTVYSVEITDAAGCSATESVTLTVEPAIEVTDLTTTCSADLTTYDRDIQVTGGSGTGYIVDAGIYTVNDLGSGLFAIVNVPTDSIVTVTVTDDNVCSFGPETLSPSNCGCGIVADATNPTDNLYCTGSSPTSISVDAAPAGFEINWYAAATGGASLFTGETYTPASAGTFYAEVEEIISGCVSTNRVAAILTEEALPTIAIANGASEDICAGASVDLVATGAISYSWSPATDLSCTDCPNPVASPSGFTTYTVTGTNLAGCTNTASIG